jgi:hypothetical protein
MTERFDKLAEALAEQQGNGNGDGKIDPKALLNITNNINEQLVFIAKQLNNDVSPRLKTISSSMGSLASQIEKASPSEEDDSQENRWWRSFRGNRK